jgi:hypothetical protein
MFLTLLGVTFVVSVAVCFVLSLVFRKSLSRILDRLLGEAIYTAWTRYLLFALYVVGISGGVRVWDLERYITPTKAGDPILELTGDRWVLEMFRTVIGTLQSVAWMLLVFFLVSLLAFVVVKGREVKRASHTGDQQ